ncbi:MAG: DUF3558 domain-containing protein [Haloechinothrix sp.]
MKTWATLVAGLVAGSLVAGCSGGTAGEPVATTSPTASSGLPHSGAPKVENPIDTAGFEASPCTMLTDQQLAEAEIGIENVKPDPGNSFGPTCTWYPPFEWGQFNAALLTANKDGLSTMYQKNLDGDWAFFEKLTIAAYPAVAADDNDDRKDGYCTVNVGVRDDLTLYVHVQLDDESPFYSDPCGGAEELATMAIQTMTGGA